MTTPIHLNGSRIFVTRVWARNFKSIRELDLELGPLTVLVGPNASGKSNVLDVLRFISHALRESLVSAIRARGGIGDIRHSMPGGRPDVEVGLRQIELARQALALAEEKIEIERSKLQQGLSSTYQLIQFEEDLVRAQNAEVDALVDYENALTALDRTLGTTLETWGITVEQIGQ